MAETAQVQSTAPEEQIRQAVAQALTAQGGQVQTNAPGALVVEVGSVGKAFMAGPFRDAAKMPMRITLSTQAGTGGTGIGVEVETRGTGGGYMSGGIFGVMKSRKAAKNWLGLVLSSIPNQVGAPGAAQATQQGQPPASPPPAPPTPPAPPASSGGSQFTG